MTARIILGDCLDVMRQFPDGSAQTCVTSPPYFGLRDYGMAAQIGMEDTPEAFIARLVEVFREVRRVLRDDGTLWLNLGDSYSASPGQRKATDKPGAKQASSAGSIGAPSRSVDGLKPKNLIGIPWRVAFALQADGWILRQDIIWHKPNPMPESVTDRCTKAHEYVFLLSKGPRYYYDHAAVKEPVAASTVARLSQNVEAQAGSDRVPGKTNGPMKAVGGRSRADSFKREDSKRAAVIPGQTVGTHRADRAESTYDLDTRNKRSVWSIATRPFKDAHFAVMPPELAETCILAGSRPGDTVLDPFMGAYTTAYAALLHGRNAIGAELNPEYMQIGERRIRPLLDQPFLLAHA